MFDEGGGRRTIENEFGANYINKITKDTS